MWPQEGPRKVPSWPAATERQGVVDEGPLASESSSATRWWSGLGCVPRSLSGQCPDLCQGVNSDISVARWYWDSLSCGEHCVWPGCPPALRGRAHLWELRTTAQPS